MSDVRPAWGVWALKIALTVAERADCNRKQVGAVILDARNQIVATGYNGAPSGAPGCKTMGACPRGFLSYDEVPAGSNYSGNCIAVHAEDNAIRQAQARGIDLSTCVIYCTHLPCYGCSEVIEKAGIQTVYTPSEEWEENMSAKLVRSSGQWV